MNVLSLFDGISCGRVALEKAGIHIDAYYASEIDKHAISIAVHNYPNIVEIGDVSKVSFVNGVLYTENGSYHVGTIDLMIGGSPCTDFSSIGYATGMVSGKHEITSLSQYLKLKKRGVQFHGQSYLFWEYVRLLLEVKPKYFLLENVEMAKKWECVINNALGLNPIKINSSLVSAQNRPRLYWTNIPKVAVPADKNVDLVDVLSDTSDNSDVSHCLTVQKSFPKFVQKYGYIPVVINPYNVKEIGNKACALSRGSMVTSSCATLLFVPVKNGKHIVKNGVLNGQYPVKLTDGQYNLRRLSILEMERLQTLPDGYTTSCGVSKTKCGTAIGNGWTVDVISHIFSYI